MLLWSLTLPGHEVMVYGYLVQGSVSESVLRFKTASPEDEEQVLKPQTVQAFLDAQTAPELVLKQMLHTAPLLLLPLFAALLPDALPLYTSPVSAGQLLEQVLPVTVLPNAP
ncbi:hypothetical protein [Pontibacter anaerobius]|uniref:Uncharacterized protein n=1 Tax=Pontibacter anaerobius TaxID=2993940 RepID=A0ABT3REX7_9BACT|nr:hypothetical protein [Pontibacter anaerobius]MCX2740396.1 hypothetical protein [Pontibacter anaerobius]